MPEIRTGKEAVFVGWFGPMGIGALYYALKAGEFPLEDFADASRNVTQT